MKSFVKCCAALCAVAAILAIGNSAFADPTGITYTVSTVNLPGTGGGPVVWNNMPSYQSVPGTGTGSKLGVGLDVDEMVTPLGNNMELLEWWVKTSNGGGIVPQQADSAQPAAIFFTDLSWPNMPPGTIVANSGFVYFTVNGEYQPMQSLDPGIVLIPHPLGTVPQVIALGNDELPATAFGVDTNALAPGTPLSTVLFAAGLGGVINTINDAHIGVVVQHVPEPSTIVLCGLGLIGLIPLAIRRRRLRK
jgi:PEP-CTERM motif